jgi:hypothetical protein
VSGADRVSRVRPLPLDRIQRDDALICRARGVNQRTVADYAAAMQAGAVFPPIVVYVDQQGAHWLADGFHRTAGAALAGLAELPADVRHGSRHDALLYAASANTEHGVRRTGKDKRRAVELVMREFPNATDRWIGERCGVDHKTVASVRRSRALGEIPQPAGRIASFAAVPDGGSFDTEAELGHVARALGQLERWPDAAFDRLRRMICRWWRPRVERTPDSP